MNVKLVMATFALLLITMILASNHAKADVWSGTDSSNPYNKSGSSYARGEALKSGDVLDAVVISVRPVKIEATSTAQAVGTGTGAVVGGVAGSSLGKGKGKIITSVLGGVLGGVVGNGIGTAMSETKAAEIILQLPDQKKIFVVQEDGMQFRKGQMVYLISTSDTSDIWQRQSKNYRVSPRDESDFDQQK